MAGIVSACDGEQSRDAGRMDASRNSGDGGTDQPCESDRDCNPSNLFCETARCQPGSAAADARGCVDQGSPCAPGVGCDEDSDTCGSPSWCTEGRDGCVAPGDCDGDGESSSECGGNDCDDADSSRFPANPEACDGANIDEDCDPTTFGYRDADSDGFVDASCCNGENCGDDCDDGRSDASPGASEVCNARDDDCDGSIDEEPAGSPVLCPGGMCVGGRCSFTPWDRTLSSPLRSDYGYSIDVDDAGNIYVLGLFHDTIRVSGGSYTSAGQADIFIISYGPDGSVRWFTQLGSPSFDRARSISVGMAGTVYISGVIQTDRYDFGFGERTTAGSSLPFVLALRSTDGVPIWDRTFDGETPVAASPTGGVYVVTTPYGTPSDLGGGSRPEVGALGGDLHLAEYTSSGAYVWDARHGGSGEISAGIAAASGRVVVGGRYRGSLHLGGGSPRASSDFDYYVASFDGTNGDNVWVFSFPSPADQSTSALAVGEDGRVFAAGFNDGTISFGLGREDSTSSTDIWLLQLAPDGGYGWHTVLASMSTSFRAGGLSLGVEATGDAAIAGWFIGTLDLGGGPFVSTRTGAGASSFVARYRRSDGGYLTNEIFSAGSEANSHVTFRDLAFGPGGTRAITGSFRGTANFGLGLRMSGNDDVVTIRQAP